MRRPVRVGRIRTRERPAAPVPASQRDAAVQRPPGQTAAMPAQASGPLRQPMLAQSRLGSQATRRLVEQLRARGRAGAEALAPDPTGLHGSRSDDPATGLQPEPSPADAAGAQSAEPPVPTQRAPPEPAQALAATPEQPRDLIPDTADGSGPPSGRTVSAAPAVASDGPTPAPATAERAGGDTAETTAATIATAAAEPSGASAVEEAVEAPEAVAAEAVPGPVVADIAPPDAQASVAEAQNTAPAAEGEAKPGTLQPGPEVREWRSRVVAGTEAIPVPHLLRAPQAAGVVRTRGEAMRGGRAPRRAAIATEADAAISDAPKDVTPPPAPPPDPVPQANDLVEAGAGRLLSPVTMPDMALSLRGTQPLVRDPAAQRPVPEPVATETEAAPAVTTTTAGAEPDAPAPEAAATCEAVTEAVEAPAPEPVPGTAEGVTLTDEPPPPPRPVPPEVQQSIANVMREVIARLLLNPGEQVAPLIEQARKDAYPNGILDRVYHDMGNDRLGPLTATLTDMLHRVATEAGVAADDLDAAVTRRREAVAAEALAAAAEVASAAGEETAAAETAATEETAEVAGAQDAQNARTAAIVVAAQGEASPAAIELRRDQQVRKINRRVGDLGFGYDRAKDRRHAALDRAKRLQEAGYDEAATADQRAIEAEPRGTDDGGFEWGTDEATAGTSPAAAALPLRARLEMAGIRNWASGAKRTLGNRVAELKVSATTEARGFVGDLRDAGSTATESVRTWASGELGEQRSWWDELFESFADWSQQAEAEADNWATVRAGEARDATLVNMGTLNAFVQSQGEAVDVEQNEAFAGLSAEQQAVVRAYYAAPPGNRDALGAVAAGLRFRLGAQQKPTLIAAMKSEVMGKPDTAWAELSEIGQAQTSGFNVAHIVDQLYEAMFGGVTGIGTDEEQIYSNLAGLTPEQGRAVRAKYQTDYGSSLDSDLASELDEDNALIRAKAALAGDPVMVAVGALNEAMSGAGTDEATIMAQLRGKTAEQRAQIVEEYRRQYGVDLDAALKDEMSDHDLDRADALMAGDTTRADAIAIDQAMHGGFLGIGTDEGAIEGVYGQIRSEVATMEVPDGRGGTRPLTAPEMEAEVARRNLDVEGSYNAQYGSAGDQESALRAAYADEMSGPQLDLANALADNDLAGADVARIELEHRGLWTDDKVVNGVLENQYGRSLDAVRRDPAWRARREALQAEARKNNWDPYQLANAERQLDREIEQAARAGGEANMRALENRYDTSYSRWGRGGLQVVIAFGMSGAEQDKARALVEQGGYLSRAQQVDFATRGVGTDEGALDRALTGLTAAEIAQLDRDVRQLRPGETLNGIVTSELGGREEFDATMRLRGEPENADQEMAQARDRAQWELRNSPVGGVQRQVLARRLADLENQHRLMNDPGAPADQRAAARRQFMSRASGVESAVTSYRTQVDAVADAVATVAALTAAILVTVATGGIAGAVLGALAAAAMTMAVKSALKGAAYGGDEMAVDAIIGIVDAAAAAATFGVGNALLRVATSQGGRVSRLGGTRMAATLSRMATSGSRAQRMMAHGLAEAVEGAAGTLPSALAGNMLNDQNWENGNPFLNIVSGTLMETGMGAGVGGVLGSFGGVGRPQPPAPPAPRSNDILAHRGTPQDRLDAWRAHRADNPDATMRDFLRDYDAGVAARLAADSADAGTQRALRGELLAGIPPAQRRQFAGVPITVMPDDEFARFTRSESGNAVTIIESGEPRIVMREGAPASALREEGLHLQQIAEPDLGRLARRLDENNLANWDDLSLGEQLELYGIKLELEIDAQRRLIASLDADLARPNAGLDPGALRRQRGAANDSLDALNRRALEVGEIGPLERIAMARGVLDRPQYLDQPARLFSKVAKESPVSAADAGAPAARPPRRRKGTGPPEPVAHAAPDEPRLRPDADARAREAGEGRAGSGTGQPEPAGATGPQAGLRPEPGAGDAVPGSGRQGGPGGTADLPRADADGSAPASTGATGAEALPATAAERPDVDRLRADRAHAQDELGMARRTLDAADDKVRALNSLLDDIADASDEELVAAGFLPNARRRLAANPQLIRDKLDSATRVLAHDKTRVMQLEAEIAAINAKVDEITGFRRGAEEDFAGLRHGHLGDPNVPICFAAGTLVHTPNGAVPIETLQPGDAVLAFDPSRGVTTVARVELRLANWTDLVLNLRFEGDAADGRASNALADANLADERVAGSRTACSEVADAMTANSRIANLRSAGSGVAGADADHATKPGPRDPAAASTVVRTTRSHPFATPDRGWQPARALHPGDEAVTCEGTVTLVGRRTSAERVATYNLTIATHHTYFVGEAGILVHNEDTRKYVDPTRKITRIYVVVDYDDMIDTPLGKKPRIIYVGKTYNEIGTRFSGHLGVKPEWRARGNRIASIPAHEYFGWANAIEGSWTQFETAVWEQHFITMLGGKQGDHHANAFGAVLENDRNEITPKSFDEFHDGYGHNPCR